MLGKKVYGPFIAQNGCLPKYLVEMRANKLRCETILIMSRESFLWGENQYAIPFLREMEVGSIEDVRDLIEDIDQALKKAIK